MTIELLDDYLLDAEALVERSGFGQFTKDDLARFLGISPNRVWAQVARGVIEAPAYHEELPGRGRERAIWTCAQAAEALACRLRRENPGCGTEAAFRRHRRLGEPVDKTCRDAHNARQRGYRANRKGKK